MMFSGKRTVVLLILLCVIFNDSIAQPLPPQTANSPVGVCATYTFRLQTGNGSYENHVNDVSTYSASGLMYHVGYTNVNGDRDALLQMSDRTGQVIWSKTLGIPGQTEVIESVSLMSNGNVVLTGTLEQAGKQKPFIITTAPDGTVLWMKSIATPTSYRGKAVVATRVDGIGFAAEDDSTVIYGRIENNGTMRWMKRLRLLQNSRILGMVNEGYRDYSIAFTGTDSGRKVGGVIIARDIYNDVWIHKFGGVAQNADFIFHKVQLLNLRPRVTGIYSTNNGPYKLFRAIITGSLQGFERFNIPGVVLDETASSALTAWTDVVVFSPNVNSTDLYATRAFPLFDLASNRNDGFFWARKFSGLPNYRIADVERTFDAGNAITLNLPGQNKVMTIKSDSAGLSPGCPGVDFTYTRVDDFSNRGHLIPGIPTSENFPLQNELLSFAPVVIDTFFQCRQLTCPTPLAEDTCGLSFYRVFKSFNFRDLGASISIRQNKNILMSGFTYLKPEPRSGRGIFAEFDSAAKLIDRKIFSSNKETMFAQHIVLKDGNIIVLGTNQIDDTTWHLSINKFTPSLNPLWNRSLRWQGNSAFTTSILESQDGSIFLSYQEDFVDQYDLALLKMDANGNVIWVKNYRPFPGGFFPATQTTGAIGQDADYIYTTGYVWSPVNGAVIIKTEKSTGNMVWARRVHHPTKEFHVSRNILVMNDKLVLGGTVYEGIALGSSTMLLTLDKNGNFVRANAFKINNNSVFSRATLMSNYDVVLTGYHPSNVVTGYTYMSTFLRLDSTMQVRYSKRSYDVASGAPIDVKEAPDGSIYEAGEVTFSENVFTSSLFLRKRTFDGTLGNCFNDSLVVTAGVSDPLLSPINFTPTDGSITFAQFAYSEEEYTLQQNQARCASPVFCTQAKVIGAQNVCRDTTYEYRIQRNAGCNAAASWSFSGAQVQIEAVHDSMVRVKFLANGNLYVKARLFTGCRWIEDSMRVSVFVTPDSLNLGADDGICPGNTKVLRAGPYFQTYLWQDGSTDSVFTVIQPGTYYVTTTNGCGDIFSDTIIISNTPSIAFDLGADLSKCNNDSLTITAPPGFMNYQWSPVYNISSTTGQSVIVFPATNTMYRVMAEKTPGCFAYDSITIAVNNSLPINIGADTSFCTGDSVVLHAGAGFAQYQWNTGATTDKITVKNKGRYFVVVTDVNFCRARDTLDVLNVFANPVVNLSKDSLLCIGDSRILNAGGGFIQYAWHNGSATSSISVNAPGKYWVTVRDANNCHGTDTTAITRLLPLPANFLPADTTLCTYSKLTIIPAGSFRTYAWSTGSISSSITVDKAGIYSLRAEDNFGCEGTDNITISPKECLRGIFFPNAFTPNRDRKNDTFKPTVYGPMVNFQLTIYNRWGGKVFETRDWQTGWDGAIAGAPQQSDTYAWVCTYQFSGEQAKIEKGTVVLIR